ncbi:MAG: D-alanyl-D-alanine carboxypeptidase [Gemmatimonadaceae bacterium]|nr:D-alanyl-D-alanine carboxypeptidase [Acetobacteraceae bacterium]
MTGFWMGRRIGSRVWAALAFALGVGCISAPAAAQIGSERYASIVIDAASGSILSAVNADEYRYPASLTKMMTIYMLFEALRDRRVTMTQAVPVSSWAASMSPTKLGLLPGSYITVEQALLGLVTKSANDAAAALGELLGGEEDRFAQMMTLRARALGMKNTTFRNASGLPDWSQVTTARDMAVLSRRLIQDFPGEYEYFSRPSFVFRGRTIWNHQRMLQTYAGADGLKTGYIGASGHNLATSAVRSGRRLIGVVMGASSNGERDLHMASLLDSGFDRLGVPMMMVRQDSAPAYQLGGFIRLAQAAPAAAPPPARTAVVRRGLRTPERAAASKRILASTPTISAKRRVNEARRDTRLDHLTPRTIAARPAPSAVRAGPTTVRAVKAVPRPAKGRGVREASSTGARNRG